MSIGVWEPGKPQVEAPVEVDLQMLERFASLAKEEKLDDLNGTVSPADKNSGAALMKLESSQWAPAEDLGNEQLELLIRFFTIAEVELSGWEGGKRCPVIYLVRILKDRDAFTPELRRWIKSNTDNRYLPYGSAL